MHTSLDLKKDAAEHNLRGTTTSNTESQYDYLYVCNILKISLNEKHYLCKMLKKK